MLQTLTPKAALFLISDVSCATGKSSSISQILWNSPSLTGPTKISGVQLLASRSTIQKSNPVSESTVQILLELQKLKAMFTALGNLFCAQPLSGRDSFPSPLADPPLTQIHDIPSTFAQGFSDSAFLKLFIKLGEN